MRVTFDLSAGLEALGAGLSAAWPILLGAALAILGGFAATAFQEWLARRHRRDATLLLCIDVLRTVRNLHHHAATYPRRFSPFWHILIARMAAELEVYDRVRPDVVEIGDPALRADIHDLCSRLAIGLIGLLELRREREAMETKPNARAADLAEMSEIADTRWAAVCREIERSPELEKRMRSALSTSVRRSLARLPEIDPTRR